MTNMKAWTQGGTKKPLCLRKTEEGGSRAGSQEGKQRKVKMQRLERDEQGFEEREGGNK